MESHSYPRVLIAKPDQSSMQTWDWDKFWWHSLQSPRHTGLSTLLTSQRKKTIKAQWYQGTKKLTSVHRHKCKWLKGKLDSTGLGVSFPVGTGKSQCLTEHILHSDQGCPWDWACAQCFCPVTAQNPGKDPHRAMLQLEQWRSNRDVIPPVNQGGRGT